MNILKRLQGNQTAEDLSKALAEAETSLTEARAEREALGERREEALLEPDDGAVDAVEAEIRAKDRDVDRLEATIKKLRDRHEKAVADEKEAADNETAAEGERAVARGQQLVIEYESLAKKMAMLLEELTACQQRAAAVNLKLERAGDKRRVLKPGFAQRGSQQRIDLPSNVNLPGTTADGERIWPPHDTAARTASQARGSESLKQAIA